MNPSTGRRPGRTACQTLAGLLCLLLPLLAIAGSASDAGRRLYREGRRADGSTLVARVQRGAPLDPAAAACSSCHKRSGLGTAEGGLRTPPLAGNLLFTADTRSPRRRAAYDLASLQRALVEGIAVDGRPLSETMPRYAIGRGDVATLADYLRTLDTSTAPGVDAQTIDLATVVSRAAAPEDRAALLAVVERYVALKNGGSRLDARRAAAAERHRYGERRDRAWRHWRLTVWELDGPASEWPAQLARHYAARPPFALLSGAVGAQWPVVHRFCEQRELPCVLPLATPPAGRVSDYYTLYLAGGVEQQARIAASHLRAASDETLSSVLLAYLDDDAGRAAAANFRDSWLRGRSAATPARLIELPLPAQSPPGYHDWLEYLGRERREVLVALLPAPWLSTLTAIAGSPQLLPRRLYTFEAYADWQSVAALGPLRSRVFHVYPYQLGNGTAPQFQREAVWLRGQHLEALSARPAAAALLACHVLGEGLAAIESNFSRDYFLETFEHMLDGTNMTSLVPRTTLGPGQRLLSRGGFVARLPLTAAAPEPAAAEWVDPD